MSNVGAVEGPLTVSIPVAAPESVDAGPRAQWLAESLRAAAHTLSCSRVIGGLALGYQIGTSDYPAQSFENMAFAAGLSLTDLADGKVARLATSLDGKRSKLGAWLDQMTDKIFVASLVGGVACGSFASGRTEVGTAVATAGAVFTARDIYVTYLRGQAEKSDMDINTGAQWHGKAKTALQFTALIALTSPLMESRPANWAAAGLLGVSAVLGVFSALKYRKSFNGAMSKASATQ